MLNLSNVDIHFFLERNFYKYPLSLCYDNVTTHQSTNCAHNKIERFSLSRTRVTCYCKTVFKINKELFVSTSSHFLRPRGTSGRAARSRESSTNGALCISGVQTVIRNENLCTVNFFRQGARLKNDRVKSKAITRKRNYVRSSDILYFPGARLPIHNNKNK